MLTTCCWRMGVGEPSSEGAASINFTAASTEDESIFCSPCEPTPLAFKRHRSSVLDERRRLSARLEQDPTLARNSLHEELVRCGTWALSSLEHSVPDFLQDDSVINSDRSQYRSPKRRNSDVSTPRVPPDDPPSSTDCLTTVDTGRRSSVTIIRTPPIQQVVLNRVSLILSRLDNNDFGAGASGTLIATTNQFKPPSLSDSINIKPSQSGMHT